MAQSSRPRTTDPWHTFAFVSVLLAALVVAANAYVLAGDGGNANGSADLVLLLSGEAYAASANTALVAAKAEVPGRGEDTLRASGAEAAPEPSEDTAPGAAALNEPAPVDESAPAGGETAEPTPPADEPTAAGTVPGGEPGATATSPAGPEARAAGNQPAPATVAPAVTPVAPPSAPATDDFTSVEGLTIWSGGDSMSYFMTVALFAAAEARGVTPVAPASYVVSSGLWPGGPYDWFPRIQADMAAFDPDIAVFMVGANDANAAAADPEGYARLVGEAMDLFAGRRVYWVGQPPMGREDLHASIPVVNRIFAEEAARRDFVTFVETWPIMADANGSMLWYDDDGALLRAETDGIHVTPTGGTRMAQPVIAAVLP